MVSVACTRFPTEVLGAGTYLWVNGFDQRCIVDFQLNVVEGVEDEAKTNLEELVSKNRQVGGEIA
jgi:hypothetical protein